ASQGIHLQLAAGHLARATRDERRGRPDIAEARPKAEAQCDGPRAARRHEAERDPPAQAPHRQRTHRPPKKSARTVGPSTPRTAGGELMRLIKQRDPEVPVYAACQALNVSRASLYRSWRPPAPPSSPVTRERAPSPRRLDDGERQHILDTLHLPEFADQPP